MAERESDTEGVLDSYFENDFGEDDAGELTDADFEGWARRKVPPEQIVFTEDRQHYEAYLKKNNVKF